MTNRNLLTVEAPTSRHRRRGCRPRTHSIRTVNRMSNRSSLWARGPRCGSWESFQWRERLAPEFKMAAQLLSLIPDTPSRVERLLHMEPGDDLRVVGGERVLPARGDGLRPGRCDLELGGGRLRAGAEATADASRAPLLRRTPSTGRHCPRNWRDSSDDRELAKGPHLPTLWSRATATTQPAGVTTPPG